MEGNSIGLSCVYDSAFPVCACFPVKIQFSVLVFVSESVVRKSCKGRLLGVRRSSLSPLRGG